MSTKSLGLCILVLFLFLRFWGISGDISNSDAARWHRRSERFLTAIKTADFASTYQHYQPGVTIMWINAVTKQVLFKLYPGEQNTLENADWFLFADGVSKSVVIVVLSSLLLLQMILITKLHSEKVALIYGFLMSLEPYMIGIDRWFHLTSLETYLAFTAFMVLLVWRHIALKKYLILAGVLLALSIMSKLTSLILLPLFLVFLIKKPYTGLSLARDSVLLLSTIFITCLLLFPALWLSPFEVLQKLFTAATNAITDDIRATELYGAVEVFFYPLVLLFKLSPITLVFLFFVRINSKTRDVVILIFYYMVVLSFADKKIDRYALVLIPPLLLLISICLTRVRFLVLSGLFAIYLLAFFYPVYSAYYSPIFGGTKSALVLGIYDNSGEYYAQAALYLNEKGRDVYTFVPDNIESFSYFYKGKLQREFDVNTNYVVRSVDIDRKSVVDAQCTTLERAFGPRGFKEVVMIFKCK